MHPADPLCWESGSHCDGPVEDEVRLGRASDCHDACRELGPPSSSSCDWFTFDAERSACLLMSECPLPPSGGCQVRGNWVFSLVHIPRMCLATHLLVASVPLLDVMVFRCDTIGRKR